MNSVSEWADEFYRLNPNAERSDPTVKAKKENILPLSLELSAMDSSNMDFYKSLTPEQQKEISLWILMRYMSSSQGDAVGHLTNVNDVVNVNFNIISKHPELQWKLLALCGTKKKQFHPWIAPPKGMKKNRVEQAIIDHFPLMKDDELELFLQINTQEELEQFFKDNGYDDKTIKEIFKGK